MRSKSILGWLAASGLAALAFGAVGACGGGDSGNNPAAGGGSGGTTDDAGTGGTAGMAGEAGTGGTAGQAGTGGAGGSAGVGGTGGSGGTGGTAGTGGTGGTGGGPNQCNVPNPGSVSTTHACGSLGAPPATGTCTVTTPAGTNNAHVYRGTVLAPDDVFEGGEVVVDAQGKITCVGCNCSSDASYASAVKVVCPEGVISPGLINAHDHTTYANNPPYGTASYDAVKDVRYQHRHEWRRGLNGLPKIGTNSGATAAAQTGAELRFMMSGATSINGSNGAFGILRNLDKADKNEGLVSGALTYQTFPLDDSDGTMHDSGCAYGAIDTTSYAQSQSFYVPHVAEGINLAARNEFTCLSAGNTDLLFPKSAWIHAVGLTADDVKLFSRDGTKLIWSPRSNVSLYGDTDRMTLFHKAGAVIALGTDWVPSGDMNLSRAFQCMRDLNENNFDNYFSDEDFWRMGTTNGALATGTADELGMLKKGYVGDITVFNGKVNKAHAAVTHAGMADTVLVLRGGRVMYGDSDLVTALGKGVCEDMPVAADAASNPAWATGVCGVAKKACVDDDPSSTVTLAAVVTAMNAIPYPLYYCGTPYHEPSCVPMRPSQYGGIAGPNDADGDGIDDTQDNCPNVFNPIRPLDNGKQGDFDGDTIGDECDACPFDAINTACTYNWDANDLDCDGIKNGTDDCPYDANANQEDGDSDGHGDACDKCPTLPNPGATKCPAAAATIEQVRSPSVPPDYAAGDDVLLQNVVVLGVRKAVGSSNGFYLSDQTQGPWHCIFAHTGSTVATYQPGDRVNVQGTLAVFNGLDQIANGATVTVVSSGTPLPELDVTIAQLIGADQEGYESCRVRVQGVAGVTLGTGVGLDQGGQQINANNFIFAGTTFVTVGTTYSSVKGFAGFFSNARELLPQVDADIVP